MNEVRQKASLHIERVYELKRQLGEVEDLQDVLEQHDGEDIEVGIPVGIPIGDDVWHRVRLLQDLGITSLTSDFRKILTAELEERKEVLENELIKLIGGNK